MPTISWFNGISIRMFFNDHPPPHFHAHYGRHQAQIAISDGRFLEGRLPTPQRRLVQLWAMRYNSQLMAAWTAVRSDQTPERIPGLGDDRA